MKRREVEAKKSKLLCPPKFSVGESGAEVVIGPSIGSDFYSDWSESDARKVGVLMKVLSLIYLVDVIAMFSFHIRGGISPDFLFWGVLFLLAGIHFLLIVTEAIMARSIHGSRSVLAVIWGTNGVLLLISIVAKFLAG